MEKIKRTLYELCSEMTISGFEYRAEGKIRELCKGIFDEVRRDALGSYLLIKKSVKENAKRLLIDAHFDTVGMMVTEIYEGGFIGMVQIGGLDTRVLPATEVTVYGKREIYGIITSTPPHLSKGGRDAAPKINQLYIDTGYTKEELKEIVSIGDPVGYKFAFTEMANNFVTTSGLDDKACVCAILEAVAGVPASDLSYDIYVTISAQEETGKNGSARMSFDIDPDIVLTTDVNFAYGDGSPAHETIRCGGGAGVDISSLTDKRLTRAIISLLREKGIKHQIICEPDRTHTNNDGLIISGKGSRTAAFSIPLRNMHTPCETVKLEDIASLAEILSAIICKEGL